MEAEAIKGLTHRIELVCQNKGLTYNKLAKRLDMSSTTFYQLTSGRTKQLSIEVLIKFHQILGINIEWLVTGDGPMYSISDQSELEALPVEGREMGRVAQKIDELKRYFDEEIRVKNQQIAGLQRTVDALVGKSEGATNNPLTFDEFKLEMMYHFYTQSAYKNLIAPSVRPFQLATHD